MCRGERLADGKVAVGRGGLKASGEPSATETKLANQEREGKKIEPSETVKAQRAGFSAVSEDSATKVQQTLETTKKSYEKSPNRTRGFITDVSVDMGLSQIAEFDPHVESKVNFAVQEREGRMGVEEALLQGVMDLAARNADNLQYRRDAYSLQYRRGAVHQAA